MHPAISRVHTCEQLSNLAVLWRDGFSLRGADDQSTRVNACKLWRALMHSVTQLIYLRQLTLAVAGVAVKKKKKERKHSENRASICAFPGKHALSCVYRPLRFFASANFHRWPRFARFVLTRATRACCYLSYYSQSSRCLSYAPCNF